MSAIGLGDVLPEIGRLADHWLRTRITSHSTPKTDG